jgi:UDP-2,3-diacylglucosamine pyrophosphatase LpxH
MPILERVKGIVVANIALGSEIGDNEAYKKLLRLLGYCEVEQYPLIVCGDLMDLKRHKWEEVIEAHAYLLDILQGFRSAGLFYWIVGDRDGAVGAAAPLFPASVFQNLEVQTGSCSIWMEHGHRYKSPWWKRCKVPSVDRASSGVLEQDRHDYAIMGGSETKEVTVRTKKGHMKRYVTLGDWKEEQRCVVFQNEKMRLGKVMTNNMRTLV